MPDRGLDACAGRPRGVGARARRPADRRHPRRRHGAPRSRRPPRTCRASRASPPDAGVPLRLRASPTSASASGCSACPCRSSASRRACSSKAASAGATCSRWASAPPEPLRVCPRLCPRFCPRLCALCSAYFTFALLHLCTSAPLLGILHLCSTLCASDPHLCSALCTSAPCLCSALCTSDLPLHLCIRTATSSGRSASPSGRSGSNPTAGTRRSATSCSCAPPASLSRLVGSCGLAWPPC